MSKFFWRHFLVLYTLPFFLATSQITQVATAGKALRWLILVIGCVMTASSGFQRAGSKRILVTWTDRIIIAFLLLFLVSEYWTIEPWATAQRAISLLLLYGCSFWTLWRYVDQISEQEFLQRFLQVSGIIFTLNLLSAVLLPNAWLVGRFRGFFNNPNNIGLTLSLVIPLAISQWLYSKQNKSLFVVGILILNLLACGSRSSMLGIASATIIVLISLFAKRPSQAVIATAIAIVGLGIFIQTDFFIEQVLRDSSLQTASNRTYFWELAQEYIAKRPDFGHGFGTDAVIHDYYGVVLRDLKLRGHGVMSSYYGLAVQIGWPLACCFFASLWGFAAYCITQFWRNYELISLVSCLVSGLIVCIFEPAIYSAGNCFSFLFWTILMLATRRLYYRKLSKSRSIPIAI
ncbi:MAG: O-antigen ligase family protein [Cyanobacteria bacterium P01_D01_bin.156]